MTAGSASWSQPVSRRSVRVAAFAAAALFGLSWLVLHLGFFGHGQIRDTPLYQAYGNLTADGRVPYRDFKLEYPPGALAVFVIPTIGHGRRDFQFYEGEFEAMMGVCGVGCMLVLTSILRTRRGDRPLGSHSSANFA